MEYWCKVKHLARAGVVINKVVLWTNETQVKNIFHIHRTNDKTLPLNHVPFNKSLSMTVRITAMEDVEISGEQHAYKLLVVAADNETIDLLLGLNIGSEFLDITIEGED